MNFDPTTEKLAAASTGTLTATITLGGGATGWAAAKDGDTGDVFITSFTASGGGATALEIAYSANADALERSATINITPTGAGGARGTVFALVLTQLGTAATITVGSVTDGGGATLTPTGTTYSVSSSAQTLTVPINLTAPAENVSYTPNTGTFLTVTALSPPSVGYEIEFGANTGVQREVTLTFEALDGSSGSFTIPVTTAITITQAAGPPAITVGIVTDGNGATLTPTGTNYAVSSSAQTLTVPITLAGAAENVSYTSSRQAVFLR